VVAARPFQVNPPWQAFRNLGGRSPIHRIACTTGGMRVNEREVVVTPQASSCGVSSFDENGVTAFLSTGEMPQHTETDDHTGLGSGMMGWDVAGESTVLEVTVSVPYFGKIHHFSANGRDKALASWRETLDGVQWKVPACAVPAIDCFRTAAAHILINRDGPAIQPGPRRYTRSWVRDCVIMGAALAKAGLPDALREFLTWYAGFQREDGFIPCVVDRDGIDWLVEHDSHGQFLWGIREVFRNDGDKRFPIKLLPHVKMAADYLISLRNQRMTSAYQSPDRLASYGLLPESASHEGYLAHPVHSYWDDFWGIRGLQAAADLAEAVDQHEEAGRWRKEAERFQVDVMDSIRKVIQDRNLTYIPGSVEWADFDPTATSNGVAQLDFADALPQEPLRAMLETYITDFRRKHRGEMEWKNYTAYEIRIIGAFVRLGKRDIANELLEFFLTDRRPSAWNQWPEITWRDPRSPGHLGDVPHTWIAAEYLLALASMIAAEREATDSMVLASGMSWSWISADDGFEVANLPTRFGLLDFRIHAPSEESIHVWISGRISLPPGGLSVVPPLPEGRAIAILEVTGGAGSILDPLAASVKVIRLPFSATLHLGGMTDMI
jgi:hypothetical protein